MTLPRRSELLSLRAQNLTWTEIAEITRTPREVCETVVDGPHWPKLVTRVEEDGTVWEVRYP